MRTKLVNHHKGEGKLENPAEGSLAVVTYEIGEFREEIPAKSNDNPNATIEGLSYFQGAIRPEGASMLPLGRVLTLHLQDGRKLRVIPTSAFEVKGTGGFF